MPASPDENAAKRFAAATRRLNRQSRLLRAARQTRERLLGGDEFVDRLSTARGRPSDVAAQQLVDLRGETHGVLGELGLTALEAGDESALRLRREVAEAIEPPIVERQGEVVKRLGDGLMTAFWDAQSAAEAAFAAQERIAQMAADGYRPQLRTGIHLGRPRKVGGDYLGVDVNIAARLCEEAGPGEILVSDRALLKLDPNRMTGRHRRFRAKGAPKDLGVYSLTRVSD